MKIQKYTNQLMRKFKINPAYKAWLMRVIRVQIAYKNNKINLAEKELVKFQLFIALTGQFNANFTLEELIRLQYPRSPFAMMHMHDYLRCVDSWPMEILRARYQTENADDFSYPIWIDSTLFWRELSRYNHVLSIKDYTMDVNTFQTICQLIQAQNNSPDFFLWLEIEKPANQNFTQHTDGIRTHFLISFERFFVDHLIQLEISSEILANFLKKKYHQESLLDLDSDTISILLQELDKIFPTIKIQHSANLEWKKKLLNQEIFSANDIKILQAKFKLIFNHLNINIDYLKENIKTKADLNAFLLRDDIFCRMIPLYYFEKIQEWFDKVIKEKFKEMLNKILFFSKDEYCTMQTLTLYNLENAKISGYHWEDALEYASSTLNNLGYRIDPVRALRVLLGKIPGAFVEADQTRELWEELQKTSMIQELDDNEKEQIIRLGHAIQQSLGEINIPFKIKPINKEKINQSYELAKNSNNPYSMVYMQYLMQFLSLKISRNEAISYVRGEEIASILHTLNYGETDALKVRSAQALSEIFMLSFENIKPDNPLTQHVQSILPDFEIQSAMITSYAMRAFVRIFQLLEPQEHLNLYATNQSYFELLLNFEKMHPDKTNVILVQTLSQIGEDADILFIEIHPNNIAASYQFKQDIECLLNNISRWSNKKRTVVIDITLNMINDIEIIDFLNAINRFIGEKIENIILIQSLTKFAQLGLDQRSGGLIVIIGQNNFQDCINFIHANETTDISTTNFFYLFQVRMKDNLLNYLQYIKDNCRIVYEKTIVYMNYFEISARQFCELAINSDDGACYIGLNINGLLSHIDRDFSHNIRDVEEFLSEIIVYFILPICEKLDLPLTQRISIGFPLSSINIIFGSLRLTIGLENREKLDQYARLIAYLIFLLNNDSFIQQCFPNNQKNNDKKNLLKQYAEAFSAINTNNDEDDFDNAFYFTTFIQNEEFRICIHKKNINLRLITRPNASTQENSALQYSSAIFRLMIEKNNDDDDVIPVHELCNFAHQLMIISYLLHPDDYPEECCRIFTEINVVFISLKSILIPKYFYLFGPYFQENPTGDYTEIYLGLGSNGTSRIFFCFPVKEKCVCLNPPGILQELSAKLFSMIKKGDISTAIYDIPFGELKFFLEEGAYFVTYEEFDHPYINQETGQGDTFLCSRKYVPKATDAGNMIFTATKTENYPKLKIILEHDFIFYKTQGITAYKRKVGDSSSMIEIDYWEIKDPFIKRFLSLMIVIDAQRKTNTNFIARDYRFIHFLFDIAYKEIEAYFIPSIRLVKQFQRLLTGLLKQSPNIKNAHESFPFFTEPTKKPVWPSKSEGIFSVKNRKLIEAGLEILNHHQCSH